MPKHYIAKIYDVKVTPQGDVILLESGSIFDSSLKRYQDKRSINLDEEILQLIEHDHGLPVKKMTPIQLKQEFLPSDSVIQIDDESDRSNDLRLRLAALLRNKPELNSTVINGFPTQYFTDKAAFIEICERENIPCPKTDKVIPENLVDYKISVTSSTGFVCKPPLSTCGEGILVTANKDKLTEVLKNLSTKTYSTKPQEKEFYDYWLTSQEKQISILLIQELIRGIPIKVSGKEYEPTVRIITLVAVADKNVELLFYDAYFKLPTHPISRTPQKNEICSGVFCSSRQFPHLDTFELSEEYRKHIFSQRTKIHIMQLARAFVTYSPRDLLLQIPQEVPYRSFFLQRSERIAMEPLPEKELNVLNDYLLEKSLDNIKFGAIGMVLSYHFYGLTHDTVPEKLATPYDPRLYGIIMHILTNKKVRSDTILDLTIKALVKCYEKHTVTNDIFISYHYILKLAYRNLGELNYEKQAQERISAKLDKFGFKLTTPMNQRYKNICLGPFAFFPHINVDSLIPTNQLQHSSKGYDNKDKDYKNSNFR